MKRAERELQEKVEIEVSRQLNAKDAVDVGDLDEDVESLADEMSTIRCEFKELKHEFIGIRLAVGMLSMLAIAWGAYGVIQWLS